MLKGVETVKEKKRGWTPLNTCNQIQMVRWTIAPTFPNIPFTIGELRHMLLTHIVFL